MAFFAEYLICLLPVEEMFGQLIWLRKASNKLLQFNAKVKEKIYAVPSSAFGDLPSISIIHLLLVSLPTI